MIGPTQGQAITPKQRRRQMIRRFWQLTLILCSTLIAIQAQQTPTTTTQPAVPQAPKTHLKVGQPAPDFTLPDTGGKPVKLSDFKTKKNVVLAFYVLAFTGG
jgi:cytochrome oxidase Cu insertion factor (SCO1/SenC/PrrC family)